MSSPSAPSLLAIGNRKELFARLSKLRSLTASFCAALLDMQVRDGEELLKKYDLKANDAILAEEKHMPMCVLRLPRCRPAGV